jgi:hypothetical protein
MNPIIKFLFVIAVLVISIPAFIFMIVGGLIEYIGKSISDIGAWIMNQIT